MLIVAFVNIVIKAYYYYYYYYYYNYVPCCLFSFIIVLSCFVAILCVNEINKERKICQNTWNLSDNVLESLKVCMMEETSDLYCKTR